MDITKSLSLGCSPADSLGRIYRRFEAVSFKYVFFLRPFSSQKTVYSLLSCVSLFWECTVCSLSRTMHSTYVRAQNVFGYFTTVAFTLAATIALTSLFTSQQPSGFVQLRNVQVYVFCSIVPYAIDRMTCRGNHLLAFS